MLMHKNNYQQQLKNNQMQLLYYQMLNYIDQLHKNKFLLIDCHKKSNKKMPLLLLMDDKYLEPHHIYMHYTQLHKIQLQYFPLDIDQLPLRMDKYVQYVQLQYHYKN